MWRQGSRRGKKATGKGRSQSGAKKMRRGNQSDASHRIWARDLEAMIISGVLMSSLRPSPPSHRRRFDIDTARPARSSHGRFRSSHRRCRLRSRAPPRPSRPRGSTAPAARGFDSTSRNRQRSDDDDDDASSRADRPPRVRPDEGPRARRRSHPRRPRPRRPRPRRPRRGERVIAPRRARPRLDRGVGPRPTRTTRAREPPPPGTISSRYPC